MEASSKISTLLEIMAALRDRENGCPWDIEQDFHSILPYTIEEVYEVADAIEREDRIDLCEELGDLLLQVVYHAHMAEEEGSFNFDDVVYGICKKMIRRHPHVFGTAEQKQRGMLKGDWQDIKAIEKAERAAKRQNGDIHEKGALSAVKSSLPPYHQAIKLQQKAATIGFDWKQPEPIFDKLQEEMLELQQAIENADSTEIEAEMGDIIFTVLNLARRLEINPEQALSKTNMKFRDRFSMMEEQARKAEKTLSEMKLDELERLWTKAKKHKDNTKKN